MIIQSYRTPLFYWLTSTGISVICFAVTTAILLRERQKRKLCDRRIASKYLSTFSYLCMASCLLCTLLRVAWYLPGLCLMNRFLLIPLGYLQVVAMEFYQLSRLYYCFSKNQVHSEKGYPNWVFAALYSLLVIWFVFETTTDYLLFKHECRLESDGTAVSEVILLISISYENWILMSPLVMTYIVLESTTLFLYWYKVRSLRRKLNQKNGTVYERIQIILHRVLTLTYFYMFMITVVFLIFGITRNIYDLSSFDDGSWSDSIASVIFSYSMFLMQDHNTSEYIAFLRFIKRYKCVLCFCCFGSMVNEQYRMLVDNVDEETMEKKKSIETYNTHNKSADDGYGINVTGMELSIATRTVCDVSSEMDEHSIQK